MVAAPLLPQYAILNGLNLLAHESDTGVDWLLEDVQGWGDSPKPTIQVVPKVRQPGATAGDSFDSERHIVLAGTVIAPDAPTLLAARSRLKQAASLASVVLTVVEGGDTRWANVRRSDVVLWKPAGPTAATWSIQLVATDARIFGQSLTQSTALFSSSGGLSIPYTIPYSIPAVTVSGQFVLTNQGDTAGSVVARVDGPCPGFSISHTGTGTQQTYSSSLVLNTGEFALVDMDKKTILGNGQSTASRSAYTTSRQFFGFDPGPNTFGFTSPVYNAGALLTIIATPAWG
jgi:hypothetical protein